MKLRDYYFGRRITLLSPLLPDEIAKRVDRDADARWWWKPFHVGPIGTVRRGRIRLSYASSPFEYNAKPILVWPIERTATGTVMRLVYRGRTWSRAFYVLWYSFLTVFCIGLLILGTDPPLEGTDRLMPFGIVALFALAPIAMHLSGTRNSDREFGYLIDFLERLAEAKPRWPAAA